MSGSGGGFWEMFSFQGMEVNALSVELISGWLLRKEHASFLTKVLQKEV